MLMYRFFLILVVVFLTGCHEFPNTTSSLSKETQWKGKKVNVMNHALILSAERGDTKTVLKLLKDGAKVNATDKSGRTAVLAATKNNKVDTVKALIENGADINIRDNNLNNVLLYAGAEGILPIVKLAIEAGADTKLTNRFGGTALIPASERGHVEVVKELLMNSDIDVNHINNLHWTALMEAVILGDGGEKHQKIVQLLVEHGADSNIGDKEGMTLLEHAQSRGYKKIEKILKDL